MALGRLSKLTVVFIVKSIIGLWTCHLGFIQARVIAKWIKHRYLVFKLFRVKATVKLTELESSNYLPLNQVADLRLTNL